MADHMFAQDVIDLLAKHVGNLRSRTLTEAVPIAHAGTDADVSYVKGYVDAIDTIYQMILKLDQANRTGVAK
jgi:hypothetical protein